MTAKATGSRPVRPDVYRTEEALNVPAPLQEGGPTVLVGGTGEKRTPRLAARYAHESNWTCSPDEFPRRMEALEKPCAALGRSRSEIGVSWLGSLIIGEDTTDAEARRDAFLRARGMARHGWSQLPEHLREGIPRAIVLGDPDTVGVFARERVVGQGLDGIVVNLPADGHEPEAVQRAAHTLRAALG